MEIFVKIKKLIHFWSKMLKFWDFSSKFWKTNVRFEISTFEIGCKQNFVKIRKLLRLDPECPYLGIWA